MLKIKAIILSDKEYIINGELDEEKRILILENDNNYGFIFKFTHLISYNHVVLIGTKNERYVADDIQYLCKNNNCFIYNVSLIVANCEDLKEIIDLTEIVAKIRLNPKKYINLSGEDIVFNLEKVGKFIINNKYIKIKNCYLKESEANSLILKMMEVLSIILGEFPEIEYFEFKSSSKGVVKKYFDVNGITNTDLFFLSNNKKMVDFLYFNGNNLKEVFIKYSELIENDDIQLRTYFISQSKLARYSDYILSYLIQAIEGISNFAFTNEISAYANKKKEISDLKKKGIKNINKDAIEEEDLKYRLALDDLKSYIDNNFSGNILKRLKGFFQYNENKVNMENILSYWLENDEFILNIFRNEIIRDESCKIYISKKKLVNISKNERNRIAHSMKKNDNKDYFSLKERKLYIKKYTLMFRYLVLKSIGITLTDRMKILNLERLNNGTKKRCKKCSNTNCYFKNKRNNIKNVKI